jgi:GDP-L-fucose synthase
MCWSYNRQHGAGFLAVMPTNLFGPGDNYDLQTSHVLPALIRKAHEAKLRGEDRLLVWGTGKPRREFLYSDDMAEACVYLLALPDAPYAELVAPADLPLINVGAGKDLSIRELAELVCEVVGFRGRLEFDASKPDGTPRKLLDTGRLRQLGWRAQIGLRDGVRMAYEEFKAKSQEPLHAAQ